LPVALASAARRTLRGAAVDGDRVRALRVDRRIPETAVLDALDLSLSAWRRMLAGKHDVALVLLIELASLLRVPCDALLR